MQASYPPTVPRCLRRCNHRDDGRQRFCSRRIYGRQVIGGHRERRHYPAGTRGDIWHVSLRIAKTIETPLTANVLVLESRAGDRSLDEAVMVSCDLGMVSKELQEIVRQAVCKRLPELDPKKIVLSATHTHTAAHGRAQHVVFGFQNRSHAGRYVLRIPCRARCRGDREGMEGP